VAVAVFTPAGQAEKPKPRQKIDFNRDIRPILSNNCIKCHGADKAAVQANLHLDTRAGATAKNSEGKAAIVPGNLTASELVKRIDAKEDYMRMPPPESNKILSAEDKALLRQWIQEGAEYKTHWAFVPPKRVPLPKVQAKSWPVNGIDHFILAKLEEMGLRPSPRADKATLLRRVSLDLTGLPPTPQEIDAFLADKDPKAYEKVVDRLLASKRFGERMAMDWMDYARYADSNGYQADFERFQWRWRDWVIDAFNSNMPYDQFTVEQLAGDMLPKPTQDQIVATGFNRNHRINTEGGVIAEEWRVETVIDRVETTSAVWLGLTAGCARCHDHKYDPISQKEFYGLFAYFNNVPESGTGEERPVNHPPFIDAPTPQQAKRQLTLLALTKADKDRLAAMAAVNAPEADAWQLDPAPEMKFESSKHWRFRLAPSSSEFKNIGAPTFGMGRSTGSVRSSKGNALDLGNVGDFDTTDAFSYALWVNPENANQGAPLSRMDTGNNYRGWDLYMIGGRPMVHLINSWPSNALKVISRQMIPLKEWSHVAVTYDGSAKPEGLKLYINGKPVPVDIEVNQLKGSIKTAVTAKVGGRTGSDDFTGEVDDVVLVNQTLTPTEVATLATVHPARPLLAVPPAQRTSEVKQRLAVLWSQEHDPKYRTLEKSLGVSQGELDALNKQIPSVMVMKEMPKPREARVLIRGQYDHPGDVVPPTIPAALPPLPKGLPNNRLGLAKWIASPQNPLTARVTVNRFWERFFGTGIVATSEDFGTRAEFPTHPELLDWLATEFTRLHWDVKAMMKEIVMSATYRQDSKITPQLAEVDPQNRYLARGSRFRLPGEVIRDQALYQAGLLVEKIGGRSVRPYQPPGVWDELNVYGNLRNYKPDTGEGAHRRSLYTIWKRTAAPPNMTLFDVPSRETCRIRRPRTDTPLQALALLNDETYVEAARVLAQRLLRRGGDSAKSRIEYAFKLVLSRPPTKQEEAILQSGLAKRIATFRRDKKAANQLIYVGPAPTDETLDAAELAAYTVLSSTLLNLDEAVTKE
jgi:hypothetical protein